MILETGLLVSPLHHFAVKSALNVQLPPCDFGQNFAGTLVSIAR